MSTSTPELLLHVKLLLKIIHLNLAEFGKGWSFYSAEYGLGDGVRAFQDALAKATNLPRAEALKCLFADGLETGEVTITGQTRISRLANLQLADLDLAYSLYKEDGQKILRYLYDTYGVGSLEFLRRVLVRNGKCASLILGREGNGSWVLTYSDLDHERDSKGPALIFHV